MKKITTLLLLLIAALVVVMPTFADEDPVLTDLYPYKDPNSMTDNQPMLPGSIRVGTSNWTMEFLGHRYHFVRSAVRYAHMWTDANADGKFAPTEFPTLSWNAFAAMNINDGTESVEITTTNDRTDTTSVVHRLYSYFNEDNELVMFEDHIFQYYIHNEGTDFTDNADWRLATVAETDAFKAAADPLVDTPNTRYAHVRILRDSDDADGYVLEPLTYLKWVNPDLSAKPVEQQSLLLDYNPINVVIPAGWKVVSFGTNDRGTINADTTAWIQTFVSTFELEEVPVMKAVYNNPGISFNNLAAHDDDLTSEGIQIIVDHQSTGFNLPSNVNVTRVKMFDETGEIINSTEKLSYKVHVYDAVDYNSAEEEHVPTILETISFDYDAEEDKYTQDKALSAVDSSVFGAGYIAVYTVDHPEDGLTEVEVEIAVGVLPPKFENVKTRYVDENVFVDLLGEVTANDGYGNDKTDDIKIAAPTGFNIYNPKAGEYTINLEFTHTVEVAGDIIPDTVTLADETVITGTRKNVNYPSYGLETTIYTEPFLYTNTAFQGWIVVEFDKDGKMIQSVARNTWEAWGESGSISGMSDAGIKAWLEGIDFSEGGFVVFFGQTADRPKAQLLRFGDQVTFVEGYQEPSTYVDIITKTSYKLVVDDKTAPEAIVVNNNLTIEADAFASAEAAILSNIVGVDNFDTRTQLSLFVLNNGGLSLTSGKLSVGTYTVTVGVEDRAGNASEVSYTLTVKAAKPTQEDVEAQIPQDTITPDQVEEAIQDALDSYDGVSVLTAVLMSLGAALVSFGGAALLFFLKKK
ncbi:hypothetical protein IY230_02725 [Acholeplasma laidlawii]|uniref:hypothetical protein n=1 Tax=Acholeplasma laidlawii TaxID=2148 RepID=UPI0018C2E525|nr:hypothetical protein [Acholeplasma laidlawii]MBG0762528.1 hypothetical protein [Acholeplasma laidlawii]